MAASPRSGVLKPKAAGIWTSFPRPGPPPRPAPCPFRWYYRLYISKQRAPQHSLSKGIRKLSSGHLDCLSTKAGTRAERAGRGRRIRQLSGRRGHRPLTPAVPAPDGAEAGATGQGGGGSPCWQRMPPPPPPPHPPTAALDSLGSAWFFLPNCSSPQPCSVRSGHSRVRATPTCTPASCVLQSGGVHEGQGMRVGLLQKARALGTDLINTLPKQSPTPAAPLARALCEDPGSAESGG